jgi:hypothetical protein
VAASARNTDSLTDLVAGHDDAILPLSLDATDTAAATGAGKQVHELRDDPGSAALPACPGQRANHRALEHARRAAACPATGGDSASKAAIEGLFAPWPRSSLLD